MTNGSQDVECGSRDKPDGTAELVEVTDAHNLVLAEAHGRGVAVFPGQSPGEVLLVASIIDREADVGEYPARRIARMVLAALASSRRAGSGSPAP